MTNSDINKIVNDIVNCKDPMKMSILIGKLCRAIDNDKKLAKIIRKMFASDTIKKVE